MPQRLDDSLRKYVYVGVTSAGTVEVHTVVSPDDKGDHYRVDCFPKHAILLFKGDERK